MKKQLLWVIGLFALIVVAGYTSQPSVAPVRQATGIVQIGDASNVLQRLGIDASNAANANIKDVSGSAMSATNPLIDELALGGALVAGGNPLPVTGSLNINTSDTTQAISFTAANQTAAITMAGYYGIGFSLTGVWSATVVAEWSPDNSNWSATQIVNTSTQTVVSSVTATGQYSVMTPGGAGYVRVRCSAYVSGTVGGTLRATTSQLNNYNNVVIGDGTSNPANINTGFGSGSYALQTTSPQTSTTWSASGTGAVGTTTATGMTVATFQVTSIGTSMTATPQYTADGGTTWVTAGFVTTTSGVNGFTISAVGNYEVPLPPCTAVRLNITAISGTCTGTILVSSAPRPPVFQFTAPLVAAIGGTINNYQTASLTNSALALDASPGQIYGYYLYNPNSNAATVELFNATTSNVTLGTTAPYWHFTLAGGASANVSLAMPMRFTTAISVAAVTAYNGSTAPASNLDVDFQYY